MGCWCSRCCCTSAVSEWAGLGRVWTSGRSERAKKGGQGEAGGAGLGGCFVAAKELTVSTPCFRSTGSHVYAPPDFQIRSARVRSWRLDLIDASHLTAPSEHESGPSAKPSATQNDTRPSPTPSSPLSGSRLPTNCAHLDAYLGVSYSLQFSAPWNVALRQPSAASGAGGAERATHFVDPFGPHSHDIFNGAASPCSCATAVV